MEEEGRKRKRKKESKRGKGKAVGRETKSSCVTIINAIFKWALLLQYSSDGAKNYAILKPFSCCVRFYIK